MKTFISTLILLSLSATTVQAQSENIIYEQLSAYERVIEVADIDIPIVTVVELPLVDKVENSRQDILVREIETNTFIGSYLKEIFPKVDLRSSIRTIPGNYIVDSLIDGSTGTQVEFPVINNGENKVIIELRFAEPIKTTGLQIIQPQYADFPVSLEIKASINDVDKKIVLAKRTMNNDKMYFAEQTASVFEITFYYNQPLRMSELNFIGNNIVAEVEQSLRWLAQPEYTYEVYYEADRPTNVQQTESGRLFSDKDVLKLNSHRSIPNKFYRPADRDGDGVLDEVDNCKDVANIDQLDINSNGAGDACEDFDRDGVMNDKDNCVNNPNVYQEDEDFDGIGDVCDESESRLTERNPWIPWFGIGMAFVVILILFILVAKGAKEQEEGEIG